jgi:hypothetical protein
MPERKKTVRVTSTRAQGKDSWVELIPLTVREMRELRRVADEKDRPSEEREAEQLEVLQRHIVSWNWVDADGRPLASPTDDPAVMDDLTTGELKFLVEVLNGGEAQELKN